MVAIWRSIIFSKTYKSFNEGEGTHIINIKKMLCRKQLIPVWLLNNWNDNPQIHIPPHMHIGSHCYCSLQTPTAGCVVL